MDTTDTANQPLGSAYLLGEVLGAGASGQVRACTDRAGHEYAVKLLHPSLAGDPAVVRRFVAERDVLRAIRDPHVVAVTDLVIEGTTLAIVMERVDGGDLRDRLRESGTIAPDFVAGWGSHIAAGLHAAHMQRVVHRGVKPENVLLDESHLPSTARLSDFGVARLLGEAHTGMLLGTPHYLAPELAQGAPATPAADLYALGITLYELACGHVPYAARRGPQAVLAAHVQEEPGRPLGVPDRLWEIIRALLEPDPARRLAPAGRVGDELRAAAEDLAGAPAARRLPDPPPTKPRAGAPRVGWAGSAPGAAAPARAAIAAGRPGRPVAPALPHGRVGPGASIGPGGVGNPYGPGGPGAPFGPGAMSGPRGPGGTGGTRMPMRPPGPAVAARAARPLPSPVVRPRAGTAQRVVTVLIFLLAAVLLALAAWLVLRPADGAGSLAPLPTVSGIGSADG